MLDHDVFKKIFEVSELYNMDEATRLKILENMTTERFKESDVLRKKGGTGYGA